ncbi:hypothetical protein JCM8547_007391 [Rhodosporidiobolus lusitaniae]
MSALGSVIEVTSVSHWNENLREAKAAGQTVVVDAYATWCGPCKAIAPAFDSLAKQANWVRFLRFDVDKHSAIAQKYKISAMPTFFAIKAGQVAETLKGADPAALNRLVYTHAGPNPPVPPLSDEAEKAKDEGNAAFKAGEWEKARERYSTAIELAPTSFSLLTNRSLTSLKLSPPDFSSALADAETAVKLSPSWAKGHVRRGEALEGLGRVEEAVKAYEEAVKTGTGTVKREAEERAAKAKANLA